MLFASCVDYRDFSEKYNHDYPYHFITTGRPALFELRLRAQCARAPDAVDLLSGSAPVSVRAGYRYTFSVGTPESA